MSLSSRRRERCDGGASLTGVLVVLMILGGLSAAIVVAVGGTGIAPSGKTGVTWPTSREGTSDGAGSDVRASAAAACRVDYDSVAQAADEYVALNGHRPASLEALAPELKDSVASPYFTLSIGSGGTVEVATKGHPAAPGPHNCDYAG